MLYGESNVSIPALQKWSAELDVSLIPYKEESLEYRILCAQLDSFKAFVAALGTEDDWRVVRSIVSPRFMETFFCTPKMAMRIGNYYECFLVPADIATKKVMFRGYGDPVSLGEIRLRDNESQFGSIGIKSDLMWSVFYDYFIVEPEPGAVVHTLANHEEFMTLQLWNVAEKSEPEIEDYINNILLKISMEHGLNFVRRSPEERWREYGLAKKIDFLVSDEMLESIPVAYMNYALTCDNPRMAFLHFYQVLEYFFVRAQNKHIIKKLTDEGFFPSGNIKDSTLRRLFKEYSRTQSERESLKLVLEGAVDTEEIKAYIQSTPELLSQYTEDTSISETIRLNLNAASPKIIGKLAERIYFFRCAIAHAKGDVDEYLVLPDVGDKVVADELPLIKMIAKKVLFTWGK